MENFEEEHCRLCLNVVSDGHFEKIKNITKDIFDALLLKLNFDEGNDHIICNVCSTKITEAFKFKSMCLYTNNTLVPYVSDQTGCSVDLREIYAKESGNKKLTDSLGDHKVCRLCMQLIMGRFVSVHELQTDVIDKYIPEINFSVIEDPIICRQCFYSFGVHSSFIKSCLEVQEKIKGSHNTEDPGNRALTSKLDTYVKTEEIDIKSEISEREQELLEIYSVVPELEGKETSNEMEYKDIKLEDTESGRTSDISIDRFEHKKLSERKKNLPEKCLKEQMKMIYNTDIDSEVRTYECDLCDFTTKYKGSLETRQLTHADSSEIQMYKCDVCDFMTKNKYKLRPHQLKHADPSEVPLYKCDLCDFMTKYRRSLRSHQLKHADSTEVQMYTCDVCDFRTKYVNNFKAHQVKHADPSEVHMYECNSCDYKTNRKFVLKRHQLKHSRVEKYKCDLCNFTTMYKNSLNDHQLAHADPSEVQMYTCDVCEFRTKYINNFRVHQVRHADPSKVRTYKCNSCDYKTNRRGVLKRHELIHSGVQKYMCDLCGFATNYKDSLKKHQFTHAEIQIYKCDLCDFNTNCEKNFRIHQLRHADSPESQDQ
ncbi:zinc finger protein 493-like [Anoplophora glabripennis]|uniref:zinc finger protein 493-like n=1 Tax=Anoplophora glabripennis TaxID=217634 RepID=UPI000873C238|nr:zinc finger protein 493-like [Anoplophora glabripennis]